jgi:hypothetical protein
MLLDGMKNSNQLGYKIYEGYKTRAVFPDYTKEAVEALVGMLNHKPAVIELPTQLEPLRDHCTLTGESLLDVLRNIHAEQFITGRVGLLADMPEFPDPANPMPHLATYIAESIINWDDAIDKEGDVTLNLVVLNESGHTRDADFTWREFKKFRVLQLGTLADNEAKAVYKMGVFDNKGGDLSYSEDLMRPPMLRGATLEEIPFVFINTRDLHATPDLAPLMGLGRQVLTIYRGEADYRQNLFMQGQDTLVVTGDLKKSPETGEEEALRVGAGSMINIEMGGSAEYVGVSGQGLAEQGKALEADRKRAEVRAGQLIPAKNQQESGDALKTRVTAQTASLKQIALTSAKGLETELKIIARWMGADPEKVKVQANLEFGDFAIEAGDIVDLMSARTAGAPLSKQSIHNLMVKRGYTTMTYEEEMDLIGEEDAQMPRVAQGGNVLTPEEQLLQKQQGAKPPAGEEE